MFMVNKKKFCIFLMVVLTIMGLTIIKVNAGPHHGMLQKRRATGLCSENSVYDAVHLLCEGRGGYHDPFGKDEKVLIILKGIKNLIDFCCFDIKCSGLKFLKQFCKN